MEASLTITDYLDLSGGYAPTTEYYDFSSLNDDLYELIPLLYAAKS